MHFSFSTHHRQQYLAQLQAKPLDLLVIGGGITGAGIALDAQVRGMHTGLLEMQDFAAGTSSRSTKLIHGGLRYLKQLEFKLVAEVGRERAVVYENGPHVTRAEPMLLPLFKGGSLGKWSAALGVWVYDLLAGVQKNERRKVLSPQETSRKEPLLQTHNLEGGVYYYEYRTDDARLTLEVLKEAVTRGVRALNYMKVTGFVYAEGKVTGVEAEDQLTKEKQVIYAKKVVNATGPWVDTLDTQNDPAKGGKLHITKGIHIVLDGQKLPLRQAAYFDTPDGRMVFAIPRNGKTYIGTTDTTYTGDVSHPVITIKDQMYLVDAANQMFPQAQLQLQDIESGWAGLRPLIRQAGKGPSEISRKDEIFVYKSGLITIAGGKLTGYRKMAERVVNLVAKQLQLSGSKTFAPCSTQRIPISGGKVGGSAQFAEFVSQQTQKGVTLGLSTEEAEQLVQFYGSNVGAVFSYLQEWSADSAVFGLPPTLLAQLRYSIESEMVTSPADFFVRRTGALYFQIDWVRKWEEPVWAYMMHYFRWSHEKGLFYRHEVKQLLQEAVAETISVS
jgi:glycerol-3-phosphate dehydrogenase